MEKASRIPASFESLGPDEAGPVRIAVRDGLALAEVRAILDAISSVVWAELRHAYGSAADVGAQLTAIAVGDDATRRVAWWNLWGNIHHQGTIYSATVPAVPILASLAEWRAFPDRVEAILFLREVAAAPGVVVWEQGAGDEVVYDADAQSALTGETRESLDDAAARLLDSWKSESQEVRRALLWFLSAFLDLQERYAELIDEELPPRFKHAWSIVKRGPESQEEFDEVVALEEWSEAGS